VFSKFFQATFAQKFLVIKKRRADFFNAAKKIADQRRREKNEARVFVKPRIFRRPKSTMTFDAKFFKASGNFFLYAAKNFWSRRIQARLSTVTSLFRR